MLVTVSCHDRMHVSGCGDENRSGGADVGGWWWVVIIVLLTGVMVVVLTGVLEVRSWAVETYHPVWSSVYLKSGWKGGMTCIQHCNSRCGRESEEL